MGFRGQAIAYADSDIVVLLIGDSHVEGMALEPNEMPESRLESNLKLLGVRARVFSVGAGGYGQDQQLLGLQEYLDRYRADIVVLWQTPTNDVWNNLFLTNMFSWHSKPTFWLHGKDLLGPTTKVGQPLCDTAIVVVGMWCRVLSLPYRAKKWERSLPKAYVPLTDWDGPVSSKWQDRWNSNKGLMRQENLTTEQSHMAIDLVPRSERMDYGLRLTRALTTRMQEDVESHGGRLVLFQVADTLEPGPAEEVLVLNGKYYRVSSRQRAMNWADVNEGMDLVTVPITVEDWKVGPEDSHLNARATEQVMHDLALAVKARLPMPLDRGTRVDPSS